MTNLTQLTRSDIRYALYRCRSGGPEEKHLMVFNHFKPQLEEYNMIISEFPVSWDVGPTNPLEIVSGHLLIPLQNKAERSLFNEDGSLKD